MEKKELHGRVKKAMVGGGSENLNFSIWIPRPSRVIPLQITVASGSQPGAVVPAVGYVGMWAAIFS